MRNLFTLVLGGVFAGIAVHAQFTPIEVTPDSYTYDAVVEQDALKAEAIGATTATVDAGAANTLNTFYEQGYNLDAPLTGVPPAGSTIVSETYPDHSFTLPVSYSESNALLVDTNTPNGTLTFTSPATVTGLSFLTTSGNGSPTIAYTLHHADGTSESGTFVAPDWFGGADIAVTVNGRVNVISAGYQAVDSGNPRLYSVDVPVSNSASPVSRIDFTAMQTNNAHALIMAVSGETQPGAGFSPLPVTGFTQDIVVEATAYHLPTSLGATTASVDAGAGNTAFTFYEIGYNTATNALTTGIPAAGTLLTNISAADHVYQLPATYLDNNVVLVDAMTSGRFTVESPRAYSGLSFLTAAGHGATVVSYMVNHADGHVQFGSITSPDWYNGENPAWIANGRVNVANGSLDAVNANNPRLYSVDIVLENSTSPVTSVDLIFESGADDAHALFFALSGVTGAGVPTVVAQPADVTIHQGTTAELSVTATGTAPLNYQWQKLTGGEWINLGNSATVSGANAATLEFNNTAFSDEGTYRAVVSNASGTTESFEGTLAVLSSATDVVAYFDVVDLTGGTTPVLEPALAAIDDTTSKYLNYGLDGDQSAPFLGPVGVIVTPSTGADGSGTIVNALRVYAANDAVDRDPINFTLEGSNDGTTYTLITSNSLALPARRNPAGEILDPLTQSLDEVRFSNSLPFKTYRVLFHDLKNNTAANSVQVGEIELLGVAAGKITALTVSRDANTVTITSSQPGTLQSTTELRPTGTQWTTEGPINGSATVNTTGARKFYRVLVQ